MVCERTPAFSALPYQFPWSFEPCWEREDRRRRPTPEQPGSGGGAKLEYSTRRGLLRTVVPIVPDAPIGYFRLDLPGGKQGYLTNTRSLCKSPSPVVVSYAAHSGRRLTERVQPKTACGKAKPSKRRAGGKRKTR